MRVRQLIIFSNLEILDVKVNKERALIREKGRDVVADTKTTPFIPVIIRKEGTAEAIRGIFARRLPG